MLYLHTLSKQVRYKHLSSKIGSHFASRTGTKMLIKFFLLIISMVYAKPITNVQINNFEVFQQFDRIVMEYYKNILIKNLIVTSDNLKLFLNMESSESYLTNEKHNNYESEYDLTDSEEAIHKDQRWRMENPIQPIDSSLQKIIKRQIGGLEGAGGDTQVVLGTFQAMLRPMSTSDILGQNSATQNSETENSVQQSEVKKNKSSET